VALPAAVAPLVDDPAHAALVTDFDGTLSLIVPDPADARLLPAAGAALRDLAGSLARVAVISGRPVAFLRREFPDAAVTLVGQYGLERRDNDRVLVDPRAEAFAAAVAAAADDVARRWPRLHVERKGTLSFTMHWRRAPGAAPPSEELRDLAAAHGLVLHPGRQSAEVRVPLPIDKGTALRALLAARPVRTCAFAGDDLGDLPAFAALAEQAAAQPGFRGVRIGVRSPESPAALLEAADVLVDGPAGLAALLAELAASLRPRG
jgi:trehalose 6-phosphate phosphatase